MEENKQMKKKKKKKGKIWLFFLPILLYETNPQKQKKYANLRKILVK